MKIAMFTNAYDPVVGGLERSVKTFAEDLREMGHAVLIVTLTFRGARKSEETIFRLPSVKEVAGTEWSIRLPVPAGLKERLDAFAPEIVHSHHPFMLGDTALRVARRRGLPLVFTHHTLYERYAYLFSRDSDALERMAMAIATEYENLCDLVVSPTKSIEAMIRRRGVRAPVRVIPTGIDIGLHANGDGSAFRKQRGIPQDAFVAGYLGRVVEAKNMAFLAEAAAEFLQAVPDAWFLVVGEGESEKRTRLRLCDAGVLDRVVMTGSLLGRDVADAYAAMDIFAFASHTDTQGIVLVESFCAGVPVIALDATGARDVVQDGRNGLLLPESATAHQFAAALNDAAGDRETISRWSKAAREHAQAFDRKHCARQLCDAYRALVAENGRPHELSDGDQLWASLQQRFAAEWDLFREKMSVLAAALGEYDEA